MGSRSGFGQLTKMRSGRWQGRYTGPDGHLHSAGRTFERKADAAAWLVDERRQIESGAWVAPKARAAAAAALDVPERLTFQTYADAWLADRTLKPRTRSHYRMLLDRVIVPTFGADELAAITPARVRTWHAKAAEGRPTLRAHAYGLLRTILGTAVTDGEIGANPCHIRGAGAARTVKAIRPLTVDELAALVDAMPEHQRSLTLAAAYCALRFGELAALRRSDVDLDRGIIRVRRGVVRVDGQVLIGTPKSDAGVRDVHMPPLVVDAIREHLRTHISGGKDGLIWPGTNGAPLAPSTLYGKAPRQVTHKRDGSTHTRAGFGFYAAREAAGRSDLRWHDLRHTGAVLAAQAGATLAELMGRLGHSTPQAALRYQHASSTRDAEIARRIGEMA